MEIISNLGNWISDNESLLSGAAAIILLLGVVGSTIGLVVRRIRAKNDSNSSKNKRLTLTDLTAPAPYPVHYAKSDGLRIAYMRLGDGPHRLIMAPGIISHLNICSHLPSIRDTTQALGKFSDMLAFDKRGQGLSDRCTGVPNLEERVNDIQAVMDAESFDNAVLMGISEGVPMCIKFAVEHPERVKGLILFGGTARWVRGPDYPSGVEEKTLDSISKAWGTGVLRNIFFPSISKEVMDDQTYIAMERLISDRESVTQLTDFMKQTDVRDLLPKIPCPTLVLHFAGDMAIPVQLGRVMAEMIPNAEFLELPGVDHSDLSTSHEGVSRVKEFVESLD